METHRPRVLAATHLLPSFVLPEINFGTDNATEKEVSFSFNSEYRGLKLSNNVKLSFYNHPEITKLARIKLRISIGNQPAGYFEAVIENDRSLSSEHGVREDASKHKYMNIFHRRVEASNRRQGIGEYGISLMEQLGERLSEKRHELSIEWIQINTQLTSLAKLIIDRDWLHEHGLNQFASPTRNLEYIPYKEDENLVKPLLESSITEAAETGHTNIPPLRFIKNV